MLNWRLRWLHLRFSQRRTIFDWRLRCSERRTSRLLTWRTLALDENCVGVVRHIALCGSRFEPGNPFWTDLLNALPKTVIDRDHLPHPTRFVEMTGIDRGRVGTFTRWIRARSRLGRTHRPDHSPPTEPPGLVPTGDCGSGLDEDDARQRRARHDGRRLYDPPRPCHGGTTDRGVFVNEAVQLGGVA